MDKPIIIKCNLMLPVEKLREVRESVKMQIADGGVVILPAGFEMTAVDTHILEQMKAEIETIDTNYCGGYQGLSKEDVFEVFDKYIKKLKGESDERL